MPVALCVLIFTMLPVMFEKNEDQVDVYAQKVKSRIKRQYSSLDEKVFQKLPKVPFITLTRSVLRHSVVYLDALDRLSCSRLH